MFSPGNHDTEGTASAKGPRYVMYSGAELAESAEPLNGYLAAEPVGFGPAEQSPERLGSGGSIGVASTLVTAAAFGYEVGTSIAPVHDPTLGVVAYGGVGTVVFTTAVAVAVRRLLREQR
jgi:hypothetical protein